MIETLNYGSHLPALMACTAVCDGPVLEIGSGHFSTPCLHSLCSALGHRLVTVESEDSWRNQFMHFDSPNHSILKQSDALLKDLAEQHWGLVLVDGFPPDRIGHFKMFFNSAKYVVFHDSNYPGFETLPVWLAANQCDHRTYTLYGPHTLVVSKSHQIPKLQP